MSAPPEVASLSRVDKSMSDAMNQKKVPAVQSARKIFDKKTVGTKDLCGRSVEVIDDT